jgi:probable addiction module antidote protein
MAKISKFDAADYLNTPEVIAAYLGEAYEASDPDYMRAALGTVARAKPRRLAEKSPGKTGAF